MLHVQIADGLTVHPWGVQAYRSGVLVGALCWEDAGPTLYISDIYVAPGHGDVLAAMLMEFRSRFAGRKILFDARLDNKPMTRLVTLLGAEIIGHTYSITLPAKGN